MKVESNESTAENGLDLAKRFGLSVRRLSSDDERSIAELPHAQKRTGHAKKAVFVASDVVFKGPYRANDVKLRFNLLHTQLVMQLEGWLGIASKTVIPWREIVLSTRGEIYLVAENLGGTDGGNAWDVVSSKIEQDVKVLPRGSVVHRVSELEKEPLNVSEFVWRQTLQHLYVLFLLGIGDEGSHNVLLARDGRVIGIDLEELRSLSRVPTDVFAALFKRATSVHRTVYQRAIGAIQTYLMPLSEEKVETLKLLGTPSSQILLIQKQIQEFQRLLQLESRRT